MCGSTWDVWQWYALINQHTTIPFACFAEFFQSVQTALDVPEAFSRPLTVPVDVRLDVLKDIVNFPQNTKGLTSYVIRRSGGCTEPPFAKCILSGKVEDDWSNERRSATAILV